MEGWVTLYRRFLSWEWFSKAEMVQLFIYLLLSANHTEKKWQGMTIKRGQLLTSIVKIQAATSLSVSTIRTCLKRLETTGETTSETTNRYTIITICNYDKYQVLLEDSDKPIDTLNDNQTTIKRQSNDNQTTTNNNDNNVNNDNNDNNISLFSCENLERERDEIFKIFFLKNFANPEAEVERFYNHYEAQGWERGNGQKITNRTAAAKVWEQEDKAKRRFPEPFIEAMRVICAAMSDEDAIAVTRGIVRIEIDAERLSIYCTSAIHEIIEGYSKGVLQRYTNREVFYRVKRMN